ncbi:MAG TPA: Uma2 family endonuclease [Pirellulales bacterium]|nr:Uma2 family endonuclease [Pirellulales bacterium]
MGRYEAATPGVEGFGNVSTILSSDSEPQPDETLVIAPDCDGQTRPGHDDEPLQGAPELIVEVASSSVAYDLHNKYRMYERAGVREYVVVVLREKRVRWFVSDGKQFNEIAAGQDGIFRSALFAGLWLDAEALFRKDLARLLETLDRGLASPEHAAFVEQLKSRRKA